MKDRVLDWAPTLQVLDDDAFEQIRCDTRIPGSLRIDHNDWSARADAEAGSFAALHARWSEQQPFALEQARQARVQVATAPVRRTETARAHEDVASVRLHESLRFIHRDPSVDELVVAGRRDMAQLLHRTSAEDVLLENPLRAFAIDAGVPDILGIHNNHGPMAALVHAARVIDANDALQPAVCRTLLQDFMHFLGALCRAGFARGTDKHVMTILAQLDGGGEMWDVGCDV